MLMKATKRCPGCLRNRRRAAFSQATGRGDGLASRCRECVAKRAAEKKAARATCTVEGCAKPIRCSGLCFPHHARWKRFGDALAGKRITGLNRACIVPDCGRPLQSADYCIKHNYRFRTHGDPMKTVNAPKGSGSVTRKGYRTIMRPGHPNAQSAKGAIHEQRYLMSESLGRALLPHEEVHHKNGQRADNRIVRGHELKCPGDCCNLELWSKSQPRGQRVEDKVAWAMELLRAYRPDALTAQASAR